jgi:hypothetical protein
MYEQQTRSPFYGLLGHRIFRFQFSVCCFLFRHDAHYLGELSQLLQADYLCLLVAHAIAAGGGAWIN